MIVAGVAQIGGSDGVSAAQEAARRAMTRASTLRADLALLLATPDHRASLRAMTRAVRDQTHARHVVGATVAGTCTTEGEIEEEHGVLAMVLGGDLGVRPVLAPSRNRGYEAGREIGAAAGPDARLLVLLADPAGLDPGAFVEGLTEGAGGALVAGAGLHGGQDGAMQILDDREVGGHVVGVAFGGRLRAAVEASQACRALGDARVVTGVEGNVILTIDERPALETFAEVASGVPLGDPRTVARHVFVGLSIDDSDDYVTRPVVGFDVERGGVAVGDLPDLGQRVVFCVREALGARDDLRGRVRRAASSLGVAPAFGFYFNCAGRGSNLYGTPGVDAATLRQCLGDVPVGGCSSSFELATTAGAPRMHLFSGVAALVAEAPAGVIP